MLILRYKLDTATADDGGILTFFTLRICTLVVWKHYTSKVHKLIPVLKKMHLNLLLSSRNCQKYSSLDQQQIV